MSEIPEGNEEFNAIDEAAKLADAQMGEAITDALGRDEDGMDPSGIVSIAGDEKLREFVFGKKAEITALREKTQLGELDPESAKEKILKLNEEIRKAIRKRFALA